jgi:hypothetical protein
MAQKGGIGSHTKPNQGDTNTWLTPEPIVRALGPFDLDPCAAPSPRPWDTAKFHIELPKDGLAADWSGPWCNSCGAIRWGIADLIVDPPTIRRRCAHCAGEVLESWQPYRVWLNPPYGKETDAWLAKLADHKSGIALIFARTETATWTKHIWPKAHSIFFFEGRLWFHHPDGTRGKSNAGGPSALISYSLTDTTVIRNSGLKGTLVESWAGRRF